MDLKQKPFSDLRCYLLSFGRGWSERVKYHLKSSKRHIACWSVLVVCATNDHISRMLFMKYIVIAGCWELRAPVEMSIGVVLWAAWQQTPEPLSVGFLPREMSTE